MVSRKRDDITIRFGGDDSRFQKTAKKVGRTATTLKEKFKSLGNNMAGAFGIGGGLAAGGAIAGVAKMTQDLDRLGKTAVALNTTVEQLSALQFAVSQTSTVTDDQLNNVLQRLVKHIGQANRGATESQKIFQELGLSWEYLATLNSDQAFLEVADAINNLGGEYQQASVAQKIFEDNWRSILPTLKTGRKDLEALTKTAMDLGVPTTEAAQAAAQLNDSIGLFNTHLSALAYRYGPHVIGTLNWLIGKFFDLNTTVREGLVEELLALDDAIADTEEFLEAFGNKMNPKEVAKFDEKLADLTDQYWKLTEAIIAEDAAAEKAKANRTKSPPTLQGSAPGGGAAGGKRKTGTSDDWRNKSPEEIAAALDDFRAGKISGAELGERAGLQPPGTVKSLQSGAFGTLGARLINFDPGDFHARLQDAARKAGPIKVQVEPEIIGWTSDESIEAAAAEEGIRQ